MSPDRFAVSALLHRSSNSDHRTCQFDSTAASRNSDKIAARLLTISSPALQVTLTYGAFPRLRPWVADVPDGARARKCMTKPTTKAAPTKPNSSPRIAKMKSVCCAGKNRSWVWVPCKSPLPNNPPEPMATIDWMI